MFSVKERTLQQLALAARRAGRTLLAKRAFLTFARPMSTPTGAALTGTANPLAPSLRSEAEGGGSWWGSREPRTNQPTNFDPDRRATPPAVPTGSSGLPSSSSGFLIDTPKSACSLPHHNRLGRLQRGGTEPPDYGCLLGQLCPAAMSGVNR